MVFILPLNSVNTVPSGGTFSPNQVMKADTSGRLVGSGYLFEVNGNVGIGTGTPVSSLHVVGDARVDGTIINNNDLPEIAPSLMLDFANVKELDPRIAFTRASSATYYDGKTFAKAEENLLTRSQEFNLWNSSNITVTSDATTAPDGTSTAELLTENNLNDNHVISFSSFTAGTNTWSASVYAKTNGRNWIILEGIASNNFYAWFDISSGVVGTAASGTSASIESVGNGWYRCKITKSITGGATQNFRIYLAASDGTIGYTGDGASGVYVWGAQLELRSAVTAYTPTTTQPITNYIPALQTAAAGVARFDHDPITCESLGLLIEEQRTNLLTYSEDFADAAWTKVTASVMANTNVAPDGTLTADKFIPNSGSSTSTTNVYQNVTKSAVSTTYAVSCYGKPGEFNSMRLYFSDGATAANRCEATYNLSTGVVSGITNAGTFSGASASMTAVGNGWYRCVLIATTSTETSVRFRVTGGTGGTGDGYSGIYIWGAQLEAGAFPTSYIKTEASQVTRSADAASMTGTNFSSWYRQDEGTLFAITQLTGYLTTSNPSLVATANSASISNNNINMFVAGGGPNYRSSITESGVGTFLQNVVTVTNIYDVVPWAIAYKNNDAYSASRYFTNNPTDTAVIIPTTVNALYFDASSSVRKYIRKIAYYPKRLTNAQLQALTR